MSTAVRDILLRAVRARRSGTCTLCGRWISPERFDVIAHLPGRGWAHVDCAERWLDSASSEETA